MSGGPAREVLDVVDVMTRYGLRDRRAARRLMDEAGAFMVGGRLVLRREDLLAYEEALRAARRPAAHSEAGGSSGHPRPRPRGRRAGPPTTEPLRPGWWRSVA